MDEVWLLPPSVQEFVPEGHPAHLVRDIVAEERKRKPTATFRHGAGLSILRAVVGEAARDGRDRVLLRAVIRQSEKCSS